MEVYIYSAALWCTDCALDIMSRPEKREGDIASGESDRWPQGPYSDGGGEADSPQHCDGCGCFLENPLTGDGYDYVAEAIGQHTYHDRGSTDVLKQWAEFYKNENTMLDNAIQEWQALKPEDWK